MAPPCRALLLLVWALVLLGEGPGAASPAQPRYPGDDATLEELERFYQDLQQYLNVVTRHRYGKRSGGRALEEEPFGTAGC
ncbi:pancreatic polypeptide-like [Lathamus discolor]|uniref:pancreatic polypeptide-like n=1 Tax=Lathamus discolor TaxID=678569 RepID=UPI0032B721BE